jgi:hypothetical protein
MARQDRLVTGAERVVRVVRLANRAFMGAVGLGLLVSVAAPEPFLAALLPGVPATDTRSALDGARLLMMIGLFMSLAADRLFGALAAIVTSAGAGDPFIRSSAAHLRTIGWCLLGLQLLEFPAAMLRSWYPGMGSAAPSGDISIAGWIATLMVFVLSRVFEVGAAMRDDLEGTV